MEIPQEITQTKPKQINVLCTSGHTAVRRSDSQELKTGLQKHNLEFTFIITILFCKLSYRNLALLMELLMILM